MNKVLIPKPGKPGKFRAIYAPDPELKRRLRALVPQLNLLAEELDTYHVQHGFTEGRSPLTNAKVHVGYEFTVSFDLQDFFDTVTPRMVYSQAAYDKFPSGITYGFVDGAPRQGLPTSPALANIAASPMDKEIVERFCTRKGRFAEAPAIMTRYADDIAISTNYKATVDLLLREIPKIVEKHGFKINEGKTRVQCSRAGRRIITGVAVDEKGCFVSREVRRRIRAGEHQHKNGWVKRRAIRRLLLNSRRWRRKLPMRLRLQYQLQGLKEWAKLRLPKEAWKPQQGHVMAAVATTVAAVYHCKPVQKVMGYFGRKFGP